MKFTRRTRIRAITVTFYLFILCSLYDESVSQSNEDPTTETPPCGSGGLPEPKQPFRVVWNHPNFCRGVNYTKYGIFINSNRKFLGDTVQTFYDTGEWPTIHQNGSFINGGLPHLFNETEYNKTRKALSIYRTEDFEGLAVLDWEDYRPTFYHNFGGYTKYKDASIKHERNQNPNLTAKQAEELAKVAWETGIKRIFLAKLRIGEELMPKGYWGYYLFPQRWASDTNNNRLAWLWRAVSGLYPSVYMWNEAAPLQSRINRVWGNVCEGVRLQAAYSRPNTPLYAYINNQNYQNEFFMKDFFNITIGMVARMGASGVIVWGSSSFYHQPNVCAKANTQMENELGPYVLNLTTFLSDCSMEMCNGHGRCVHNAEDTLIALEESVSLSRQCTTEGSQYAGYHCRCYAFWKPPCCKLHACATEELTTSAPAAADDNDDNSDGAKATKATSSVGTILGVALGAVFLLLIIVGGIFYKRQNNQTQTSLSSPTEKPKPGQLAANNEEPSAIESEVESEAESAVDSAVESEGESAVDSEAASESHEAV